MAIGLRGEPLERCSQLSRPRWGGKERTDDREAQLRPARLSASLLLTHGPNRTPCVGERAVSLRDGLGEEKMHRLRVESSPLPSVLRVDGQRSEKAQRRDQRLAEIRTPETLEQRSG